MVNQLEENLDTAKLYRIFDLLEKLEKNFGASEFGRICQVFLAISLKKAGYKVRSQLVARPDITARKNSEIYIIEAKAPVQEKVTIKKEDLEGIKDLGGKPVFAILLYPEVEPKWIILDAEKLHPGRFQKRYLKEISVGIESLEQEINKIFIEIVEEYYDYAVKGGSESLVHILKSLGGEVES